MTASEIKNLTNEELLAEFTHTRELRDYAKAQLDEQIRRASNDRRRGINYDWNKAVIVRNAQLGVLRTEGHARKVDGRYTKAA